jgi:hypothetical protein
MKCMVQDSPNKYTQSTYVDLTLRFEHCVIAGQSHMELCAEHRPLFFDELKPVDGSADVTVPPTSGKRWIPLWRRW